MINIRTDICDTISRNIRGKNYHNGLKNFYGSAYNKSVTLWNDIAENINDNTKNLITQNITNGKL